MIYLNAIAYALLMAWMAYIKGFVDASHGGPLNPGTPDDDWHKIARRWYHISLLLAPLGILTGYSMGLWPIVGALAPLPFARALFRYGVWRASKEKYKRWYGVESYGFFRSLLGR